MPSSNTPQWRSGTAAIKSDDRARKTAAENPETMAAIARSKPASARTSVPGRDAGVLLRLAGAWDVSRNLTVSAGYDHFFAGAILRQADLPSGRFGFVSVTYRY